ncbi:winged helix-turn-helix domain-containing protein [Paenibacillus oenotherae]|uniref:Winged helix-turn-helix domain-containing protein n=1 Tax=Paenibacillus oenotherae TaxID=1435645 RepID=A0ABS7D513_9BACL|nr:BTAD domain-containing putative transcriptional regulator [Paenibacillus oenotherae]MBW7474946.1 winged helix-turn-helix domain-containing protein [Paenibacillus oenotherae]
MMEQQNENRNWLNEVLNIEQAILDGRMPEISELKAIPEEIRGKSPLLLRAECEDGLLNGRIVETKQRLESALKGFAAQADESAMLSMMGMLALLYGQVGDRQEAQPILSLLRQEWDRTPDHCNGFVPWALARNAVNGSPETAADANNELDGLYYAAAESFRRESKPLWSAFVLLDRLLYDPLTVGDSDWRLWLLYLERHLTGEAYCEPLYEILAHQRPSPEQCDKLPARYAYLCRAVLLHAPDEKPVSALAGDIEIQIYVAAAKVKHLLATGNRVRASIELQTMERLQQLVSTPASLRMFQTLSSSIRHESDNVEQKWQAAEPAAIESNSDAADREPHPASVRWRIKLIDGILFSTQQGAAAEPVWKRRKAGELLVYLLLQPGYKANREQLIERVFGEGEPAKRANQLYVTLHDLRQTLKDVGLPQDPVYAKRGVIGIDDVIVDAVDAETYITLSRVGDQLWLDDREAACRLYDEALPLFGQLAPELPVSEWLERIREQLVERQTVMLKRLAIYYSELHDEVRVEQRLADWIALRPEQEEAYEFMIRHCLLRGRRAEAIGWYRRLERTCREQGTEPLAETKRLLWE